MSVIFFAKEMHDLSVCFFGKAAIKEMGVLPVRHFLGFWALRMRLALIFESIDQDTGEGNFQKKCLGLITETCA